MKKKIKISPSAKNSYTSALSIGAIAQEDRNTKKNALLLQDKPGSNPVALDQNLKEAEMRSEKLDWLQRERSTLNHEILSLLERSTERYQRRLWRGWWLVYLCFGSILYLLYQIVSTLISFLQNL